MNREEQMAGEYLESLRLGPVVFEPDGNIPPDFLVGGRIAVEVRRLNENWVMPSGEIRGLESDRFAIDSLIRRLCREIGPTRDGRSWFVIYDFRRPLLPFAKLKRAIRESLVRFRNGRINELVFKVTDGFEITLIPASRAHATCFVPGGSSDDDSGGFLIPLLERNIRICLEEKGKKISEVRTKYPEWWLMLIDAVGYGSWEPLQITHDWDKLLLLDPQNPLRSCELKSTEMRG